MSGTDTALPLGSLIRVPDAEDMEKAGKAYVENLRNERIHMFSIRQRESTIPAAYMSAKLGDLNDPVRKEAVEWVEAAASGDTNGLVIHGCAGSGKTYAACAILRCWMWNEFSRARFATETSIVNEMRDATRGYGLGRNAVVAKYANVPLLCIDDVGKSSNTDFSAATVWEIVSERINRMKPTIVTTQYAPDALCKRLGGDKETVEAVMSRLMTFDRLCAGERDRRLDRL